MKPAMCIEMLFPGLAPEEKVERIAEAGFSAVEFWGWRDKDLPRLAASCARRGVTVANFSGHRRGSPIARSTHPEFLSDLRDAVAAARTLGCRTLMVLSNELGDGGRVVDSFERLPEVEKRAAFVEVMRRGLEEIVPHDMRLVIEPLNTRLDHVGNWLADVETAAAVQDAVGDGRLSILCDYYHMAQMGFDLAALTRAHAARFGYVHVADCPDRDEPRLPLRAGGIDWVGLLTELAGNGYDGFVGFEYAPSSAGSEASLARVRGVWDAVVRNSPTLNGKETEE
jgi:hydroxypyruvate isomerase